MTKQELVEIIRKKRSFLCVGLDTDVRRLPEHLMLLENPMLEFNKAIVDATAPYSVAYKPNLAFYETMGAFGLKVLEETVIYIKEHYPEHLVIADGKRGDIGNTGSMYARAYFEYFKVDGLTVAPYMGVDSVKPFLDYPDKWVVLLALTSNTGAKDLQLLKDAEGKYLFEHVIEKSLQLAGSEQLMFVVGATHTEYLKRVRALAPHSFLLVPGIGAQGGDFVSLVAEGMTEECGLLVNASRSIIYADATEHFASVAANEANTLQKMMEAALIEHKII